MDKREFLKGAGAALSGSFLSSLLPAQTHPQPRTNWSGNLTYSTDRLITPRRWRRCRLSSGNART